MARKPKKIPTNEAKDGTIQKLRNRVKRLEKENHRLKSELNAYDQAWKKTLRFISDESKEIKLEDLINAAKEDKTLKETKKEVLPNCSKCLSDNVHTSEITIGTMIICRDCSHTEVKKKK